MQPYVFNVLCLAEIGEFVLPYVTWCYLQTLWTGARRRNAASAKGGKVTPPRNVPIQYIFLLLPPTQFIMSPPVTRMCTELSGLSPPPLCAALGGGIIMCARYRPVTHFSSGSYEEAHTSTFKYSDWSKEHVTNKLSSKLLCISQSFIRITLATN